MAAKLDILRGTLDADSPLAKLRGNEDVWDNVFKRVDDWYEAHIDRESTATIVLDDVAFPEPQDININMMPFTITKIPEELSPYRSLIYKCPIVCRHARKVFYLTIQEGWVPVGQTQRRPGLHIEQPGAIVRGDELITLRKNPKYRVLAWGLGHVSAEGVPYGGIFMSSSVAGSSAVWPVQISTPGEVADAHGGIEHMRGHLGVPRILEANQLCWFTDRTPHEALPLEAPKHNPGAEFVYRQFFRLVAGPLSVWYSKHNSPNPLGVLPDAPISDEDKFGDRQ